MTMLNSNPGMILRMAATEPCAVGHVRDSERSMGSSIFELVLSSCLGGGNAPY
jgi:hypothetical protein